MIIYALHGPTADPEHGIPCFSTEALAHGALDLYGLQGWSVWPVELYAAEIDMFRWRREGRPLLLRVAFDRETCTRPAKAYTRPWYYVDEVRRIEQKDEHRGLLDALRPSVECGLQLWRVSMHRDGTPGPVVNALHLPAYDLEGYPDDLLVGTRPVRRVSRGCRMQQEGYLLFVHARDAAHAAEVARPALLARVEEQRRQGRMSLLG